MNRQKWTQLGWTDRGISYLESRLQACKDDIERKNCLQEAMLFSSPLFQEMWERELMGLTEQGAQALLKGVMQVTLMPRDLSGTCAETAFLLSRFWPNCPPHSLFWSSFSSVVQLAFGRDLLASQSGDQLLKRQIHQFRYLISAYQAEWLRRYVKKEDQTDQEALQTFLQSTFKVKVDAYASARLHNKAYRDPSGKIVYPSGHATQFNFKVLLNFHTEYILDQEGSFLNEVDPHQLSINGIVNGASFNYGLAKGSSHKDLDIDPVKLWDPPFRKQVLYGQGKRFVAPKKDRGEQGYYSQRGVFSKDGKSYQQQVAQHVRIFLKGIPRLRVRVLLKNMVHRFR